MGSMDRSVDLVDESIARLLSRVHVSGGDSAETMGGKRKVGLSLDRSSRGDGSPGQRGVSNSETFPRPAFSDRVHSSARHRRVEHRLLLCADFPADSTGRPADCDRTRFSANSDERVVSCDRIHVLREYRSHVQHLVFLAVAAGRARDFRRGGVPPRDRWIQPLLHGRGDLGEPGHWRAAGLRVAERMDRQDAALEPCGARGKSRASGRRRRR